METKLPASAEQVLDIIIAAERRRRFVWTAGRVLRESALWGPVDEMSFDDRKAVLRRLGGFLENLAARGFLQRRDEPQSIGYGDESGFDYIRHR